MPNQHADRQRKIKDAVYGSHTLLSAPLLIGGDLTKLDAFTLNLLTNDEVIAVDQGALGKQATRIAVYGDGEIWAKEMEDGSRVVGLFNRGIATRRVAVAWTEMHLSGAQVVHDLWRQKDNGTYADRFESGVPPHGVVLIALRDPKKR
jgi:alpha-galactosidase